MELEDRRTRVTIAPDLGGGVAGMWAKTDAGDVPVLRPLAGDRPFDLASNVLVPFSNRIGGAGFVFEGQHFDVPPNLDGEGLPIHGDGFQRRWQVEVSDPSRVVLRLDDGAIGPWHYSARLVYSLKNGAFGTQLEITNTGPRLPFGGGFHPWLPRFADTKLWFHAETVWLQDDRFLPSDEVAASGDWDYLTPRALPEGLVNNAFCNWIGPATVLQPTLGIAVTIVSPMDVAIVYSPSASADFFCFEPVSHAVDAHNMPGQPGLIALDRGATVALSMSIDWQGLQQ
nr:aldose 1-epimerase [Shimia biformata]